MLFEALLVAIGFGVGVFGTLVGAGGGFLLVPILAILQPSLPTPAITAVSLAVVAMNATSGAIAYGRQGRIDLRSGVPFALATLPGSVIGALVSRSVPRQVFDVVLAGLLIALAVFIAVARDDETRPSAKGGGWGRVRRELVDARGTRYRYDVNVPLGVAMSFAVGFVSSLLGIGGGVIHVPTLVGVLGFPAHIATATSHFTLAIMATAGTATHVLTGDLQDLLLETALLGGGAIVGAQLGARLSARVHGHLIVRALAVSLAFVGVRLGIQGVFGV